MKYTITANEVKDSNSSLKGFATLVLGDTFKITNIAIMENSEIGQLFVSMPRYKTNEKDENQKDVYQDICNPITKEFREQLYGDILKVFEERDKKKKRNRRSQNLRRRGENNGIDFLIVLLLQLSKGKCFISRENT